LAVTRKSGAERAHSKTLSRVRKSLEIPQGLGVRALGAAFFHELGAID